MKKVLAVVLVLCMLFAFTACGEKTAQFQIGQYIGSFHGTKCFGVATVVIEGDKIVKAYIDEYQYMPKTGDGVVAVPNASDEKGLGAYFVSTQVLASKRQSNKYYSANMAGKGGATQEYAKSMDALQAYCEGKTIAELEKGVDAITGCTFSSDIPNYVKGIVEAAKVAQKAEKVSYTYKKEYNVKLSYAIDAAHGNKCFSTAAVLSDGEKVIASYVDEFQFMAASTENLVPVPNSDNYAANVKEGQVLVSKRVNNAIYSANMAGKGGATQEYAKNMDNLQKFCNGKTIAELEKVTTLDATAGCTFSDPSGYIALIVKAAK